MGLCPPTGTAARNTRRPGFESVSDVEKRERTLSFGLATVFQPLAAWRCSRIRSPGCEGTTRPLRLTRSPGKGSATEEARDTLARAAVVSERAVADRLPSCVEEASATPPPDPTAPTA